MRGMAFSLHPVEKRGSQAHHLKKLNSANTLNEPWKGYYPSASKEEHRPAETLILAD